MTKLIEPLIIESVIDEKFIDSVRKRKIIPVLMDDNNISIYRFRFTGETKELFSRLIEVREIQEHTSFVGKSPYYEGIRLGTLSGKHELNIESLKKILNLHNDEEAANYVREHGLHCESFFGYYSRVSRCFEAEYHPASYDKIDSKLSRAFKYFCEYPDLYVLCQFISAYLSGDNDFNKKELEVNDRKGLITEILKSLNVELLYSTDVDRENAYVLSSLFKFDFDSFNEESRRYIKEYARHNRNILNSSLFNELILPSSGVSKKIGK